MSQRAQPYHRTFFATLMLIALVMTGLAACDSPSTNAAQATPTPHNSKSGFKFAMVTDAPASNPFWSLAIKGAKQAGTDMGVTVMTTSPTTSDTLAISGLIDSAVAANPDGLVLSIPDCAGMTPSIQQALLVGIPLISIHSGGDCAAKLGLLNSIGQTDYQAGLAAGQRLATGGANHVACINDDGGSFMTTNRCQGVKDGLKKGAKLDIVPLNLSNTSNAQSKIESLLNQDPSINAVITLDSASAELAIAATQHLVRATQFFLATFDFSPAVLQAIQQGHMLFAIDQQPYLQGYLAIALLALYKRNLDTISLPSIPTGPLFVTSANVAQIAQLEASGSR